MKIALWAVIPVAAAAMAVSAQAPKTPPAPELKPFTVVEATIPEMRAAMEQGRVTSRELVQQSLTRIALYNASARRCLRAPDSPPLNAIRSLNYFGPVIEEVSEKPLPTGYPEYLKYKLKDFQVQHDRMLAEVRRASRKPR